MLRRYGVVAGEDADEFVLCIELRPPPPAEDVEFLSVELAVELDEDPLPEVVEPEETR